MPGMNADLLAQEILVALGGRVTPQRQQVFLKLAGAIIRHIQTNMVVTATGADPQGGVTTTTSILIT